MMREAWKKLLWIFEEEDDPTEPFYDPVHLGGAVLITLSAMGCLYWLLWTLLVYEGGLFPKIGALAQLAFTSKTLKDFGYEGSPYAMGVFEGWLGNLIALALAILVLAALHRLYYKAGRTEAQRISLGASVRRGSALDADD